MKVLSEGSGRIDSLLSSGVLSDEMAAELNAIKTEIEPYIEMNMGDVVESGGKDAAVKEISYNDFNTIFGNSVHNGFSDSVMLGKFDGGDTTSYITNAKDNGYMYFDLGDDWNVIKQKYGFTDQDMFDLFNEFFLDDIIAYKKTVYFTHNPIGDQGFLGNELKYLRNNDYVLKHNGKQYYAVYKYN